MTRSPRKSGKTGRKTAAASQDEPPCRTGKGDQAINELHEALRPHYEKLRSELEEEAAGQPQGGGLELRLEDLRWEDPVIEDVVAGDEERSSGDKRLAHLRQLINDERSSFQRMIEAERSKFKDMENDSAECSASERMKADSARRKQDADLARDWLATSSRLLYELRVEHLLRGGSHGVPFPGGALKRITNLLKIMSMGRLPHSIDAVLSMPGRPERWPRERNDIAIAVFYIEAAGSGQIADAAPKKTVRDAFGVKLKTVKRWCDDSDKNCAGIQRPPIQRLRASLLEAGKRYRDNRELQRARKKT